MSYKLIQVYIDFYCKPVQINSTGASFFSPTDSHSATPMPPRKEAPLYSQQAEHITIFRMASYRFFYLIFN